MLTLISAAFADDGTGGTGGIVSEAFDVALDDFLPGSSVVLDLPLETPCASGSRPAWLFPAKSLVVQDVADVDDFRDRLSDAVSCMVVARASGEKRSSSSPFRRPLLLV